MAHNALAQDTKPRLAGFTVRVKVVGHKKEVFIFLTKPVKFQSLILLSSVNDSFYYHMFLLMIAACFFLLKYTKQVDFWSKTHFGLCSYRLGKTCKINSLLSDCECEICFWEVVIYFWTKFCRVPSRIRGGRIWFSITS